VNRREEGSGDLNRETSSTTGDLQDRGGIDDRKEPGIVIVRKKGSADRGKTSSGLKHLIDAPRTPMRETENE